MKVLLTGAGGQLRLRIRLVVLVLGLARYSESAWSLPVP
mgnify:CR=1 FL=1